jgi:hypothetical protein
MKRSVGLKDGKMLGDILTKRTVTCLNLPGMGWIVLDHFLFKNKLSRPETIIGKARKVNCLVFSKLD